MNEWAGTVLEFATELFSLQVASELIREKYFDGQCILLKDAIEDWEQQTKIVQHMMNSYDHVASEAGQPALATDSDKFRNDVSKRASERAAYIVALAKFKMLDDFGEDEAANTVLKPYIHATLLALP